MILRLAAALALLAGAAGLLGFFHVVGKGPTAPAEAHHLRAMKDRRHDPPALAPFTDADFGALPHTRALAVYAPLENRGVSLEGYVQRLLRASDGDLHLEIVPTARPAEARDTVYVTAEIAPQLRAGSSAWSYEPLAAALRPNHGTATPWNGGPRRVRVSGWLLYDFQYDGDYSPDRAHGLPLETRRPSARLTGWEIHPVTRIELWSDSLAAFVEYPR